MKKPAWCDSRLVENPVKMCMCLTDAAFTKAMDRLGVPVRNRPEFVKNAQSDATLHTFTNARGGIVAMLCLRGWEGRNPIEVAGLIVHEAVHVWQEVREYIGEKNPSSEFEAYSIQAISQDLMQGFVDAQKC